VANQAPSYYGLTWIDDPGDRKKGYPSYLTTEKTTGPAVNGDQWAINKHPEDEIRVTCAHELFLLYIMP
jgi:hypothetical protein